MAAQTSTLLAQLDAKSVQRNVCVGDFPPTLEAVHWKSRVFDLRKFRRRSAGHFLRNVDWDQPIDFIGTASWARTTDPQIHNLVL